MSVSAFGLATAAAGVYDNGGQCDPSGDPASKMARPSGVRGNRGVFGPSGAGSPRRAALVAAMIDHEEKAA
jgi:hypothetical protein